MKREDFLINFFVVFFAVACFFTLYSCMQP